MKARNTKTGDVVSNFGISKEFGTVSYIDSKGKVRFSVPLDGEWEIINEEPKIIDMETKEILLKFMKWLEKRGFIKEDLCYDTEHQVETFVNQILPQL